jgi:hypothetical protein
MAGYRVTDLPPMLEFDINDIIPVVDVSTNTSRKYRIGDIFTFSGVYTRQEVNDLISSIKLSGIGEIGILSPQDGQILKYNTATGLWENHTLLHSELVGLSEDDHPQYHNDARGDARYSQLGHTHTSTDITDFTEASQDAVGSTLVDTPSINLTYDDANNQIKADAIFGTIAGTVAEGNHKHVSTDITDFTESVQDVMGSTLVNTPSITFVYDDLNNTISASAVFGTSSGTISDGAHTHTSAQITDFVEASQDAIGNALNNSSSIALTYDDPNGTFHADAIFGTIAGTVAEGNHTHVSTQITDFVEASQDAVGTALIDTSSINLTYDDLNNQIKADAIFGTIAGTVAEGNHTHNLDYEPKNANIQAHIADITSNPHHVTASQVGAYTTGQVDTAISGLSTDINNSLSLKEDKINKGVSNGYASLDGTGKVPASQLPSYVDDVVEYADYASLPATGETGKIYVTLDTNELYRWSGTVYISLGGALAVTSVDGMTGIVSLVGRYEPANANIQAHVTDTTFHLTAIEKTDLTDGGDSSLHYHSSDRNRANHTGTQLASTISDFVEASQDAVGGALINTSSINLTYNDAGNTIKADAIFGTIAGTVAEGSHTHNLSALGDVNITSPSDGQSLTYNAVAGKWVNSTVSGGSATALSALTDVSLTTLVQDNLLAWDAVNSKWTNQTAFEAGVQPYLVSGTNIKTINGNSLLGTGDLVISGTGGATAFIGLTDVPSTYTGSEGYVPRVKLDGTGLEFIRVGTGTNTLTFTNANMAQVMDLRTLVNVAYKITLNINTPVNTTLYFVSDTGTVSEPITGATTKIISETEFIYNVLVSGSCSIVLTINYKI